MVAVAIALFPVALLSFVQSVLLEYTLNLPLLGLFLSQKSKLSKSLTVFVFELNDKQ